MCGGPWGWEPYRGWPPHCFGQRDLAVAGLILQAGPAYHTPAGDQTQPPTVKEHLCRKGKEGKKLFVKSISSPTTKENIKCNLLLNLLAFGKYLPWFTQGFAAFTSSHLTNAVNWIAGRDSQDEHLNKKANIRPWKSSLYVYVPSYWHLLTVFHVSATMLLDFD